MVRSITLFFTSGRKSLVTSQELKYYGLLDACTLAVTTLESIPPAWLPTELHGPFSKSGHTNWYSIWEDAAIVAHKCLRHQKAGMIWYSRSVITPDQDALGLFFYSTGSMMDEVVGPAANSMLVFSGVNKTDSYSRTVNGATS